MEVVYHDECAYKQNDSGGAAWENDEKGAAMSPKNEGAAVMVSDLIGEERGQLDIPAEVYAIMQEHGTMPKREITDEGATLSRSDTYVGRCKPCEEYPDGMKTKKVSDAVHSLERVLSELNIDCKESGPEYNLARSARIILRVGKNLDGYWDSNRLCVQLEAIFAAFEISREPGRQMLAVFDNSTGHNAYSPDALRAQNIRASPGGEQIPPRNFEYNGRTIYTTFREGDVLCFRSSPFARKTEAEAVGTTRSSMLFQRFWGYTKSIERRVCDYSVLSLLARLPMTLSTVSLSLCRKWARVSWLYIYAYSHGLEGYLQTRDLKKWTNHRSPTDTADNVLLARGQATTAEERKAKEQAALAAAKEARKKSNEAADKMLKRFVAAKVAPPHFTGSTSRRDVVSV
ncbi:unnamed protein product [Ectocarpus sp. CCAP 1310/34]|nr:unnamed protein product [Ectocarpus sp. CCAP 1310/34]